MTDSKAKSNAEVARELAVELLNGVGGGNWIATAYAHAASEIESALVTAQSQLAQKVIWEIQTTARPTALAINVVTDLFTRMGIEVKE